MYEASFTFGRNLAGGSDGVRKPVRTLFKSVPTCYSETFSQLSLAHSDPEDIR